MKTYSALLSYVYTTDDGLRESTSDFVFLAEDARHALDALVPLKKWFEKQYKMMRPDFKCVGCIKLNEYVIAPPAANGSCNDTHRNQFFEWKYDWPGTLDDYVQTKKENTHV